MPATKTLIGIQDEYIRTVVAGAARWAHSKTRRYHPNQPAGGHYLRICRGAHTKAFAGFKALGFTDDQCEQMIADAMAVAKLEMNADE